MRMAITDSSIVTGSAVASISLTGCPVRIETPRSPRRALVRKCQNCTSTDWSRPYFTPDGGQRLRAPVLAGQREGRVARQGPNPHEHHDGREDQREGRLPGPAEEVAAHRLLGHPREGDPDDAVREHLDALDRVGHTGEVALPVEVDDRVVLVQLLDDLAVEVACAPRRPAPAAPCRAGRPPWRCCSPTRSGSLRYDRKFVMLASGSIRPDQPSWSTEKSPRSCWSRSVAYSTGLICRSKPPSLTIDWSACASRRLSGLLDVIISILTGVVTPASLSSCRALAGSWARARLRGVRAELGAG